MQWIDLQDRVRRCFGTSMLAVLIWGLASACTAPPRDLNQREAISSRDQRQRDLPRPPLVDDGRYVWVEAHRDYDAPPEVVWERFFAAPLSDILGPAGTFPGVEQTVLLRGEAWDQVGARRRIEFNDGHSVVEQLLSFDPPHAFSTQFWDLTSDDRRGVAHGTSRWTLAALDDGRRTRVRWRYGLLPHNPIVGLIVRRKAEDEVWPDQLEAGLRRLDDVVVERVQSNG